MAVDGDLDDVDESMGENRHNHLTDIYYQYMHDNHGDIFRSELDGPVDIRQVPRLGFETFMCLPPATSVDWSISSLRIDASLVEMTNHPIEVFLCDENFDQAPSDPAEAPQQGGAVGFDYLFFHLMSWNDFASRRMLWEYREDLRTVDFAIKTAFYSDFDRFIAKYETLLRLANGGSLLAQSRLFSLLLWMCYSACRTYCTPLLVMPNALSPDLVKESRQEATSKLRDLFDVAVYAQGFAQEHLARQLFKSCLITYTGIFGDSTIPLIMAAPSTFGEMTVPTSLYIFGDVVGSQIQVGTENSNQSMGEESDSA